MAQFLDWLAAGGDQIGVVGVVMIVLFVVVFGVQMPESRFDENGKLLRDRWGRPWWVPGWVYHACEKSRLEQKAEIKEYVDNLKAKVEMLERAQDARRRS